MNQDPNVSGHDKRIAQADARTDQANIRTDEANTRTIEANLRTDEANTRTEHAEQSEQALRASELSYRRLFEAARDGILILDVDTGRITDANPFLIELLGFSHDEMVGKTVGELSPFKDILSNQAMLDRLQKDGYIRYEDLPLETRDGRHIAVEFVSNVYQAGDKKVIQCNIRDVTEGKRAQAALLESKRFLQSTLDALTAHIAILDEHGTLVAVNAAWRRFAVENHFMGSECGMGANYLQVCDSAAGKFSEEATAVASGIRAVIDGQRDMFTLEYPCHSPQEKRWFILRVTRFGGDGSVRVVVAHENISERKRVQEAHDRLAMAVEQAAEAIVITDTQGAILYTNPAFEKNTGYSRVEADGRNPRILKSGKHAVEFYQQMWGVLQRGEVWSGHIINRRKSGELLEEEATISPVRDATGKVVNYVAVKRDVTREKQLESQIRQKQKMESIGTLAGGVAHDFNNILAVIQMQAELLKSGDLTTEQLGFAEEIGTTVQRAAALTRQLLLFSRQETLQPRDLDLNQSIHSITNMLRRILGEDIQIQFKFSLLPLFIHADAGMMDQVLLNLAVNSRDAMPRGGSLIIETSAVDFDETITAQSAQARPGSFVCLSVSDNGCGISPENISKIFEPFFTTKDVGKGTGLGLATVFGIVQQHKGWVNVYSEVGQGTAFRIYLPRLTGASLQKPEQPLRDTLRGGNETILLVEDDDFLRPSVVKTLSRLGYRVLEASNAIKALDVWAQHRDEIHLVLTDLVMPGGMNGKDLSERLLQENPKLKVIYASGYSAEIVSKDFPLNEGTNFLTKPFQSQKLAQTIRQSLDTPTV